MRRDEFVRAVQRVREAIIEAKVVDGIRTISREPNTAAAQIPNLFESYAKIMTSYSSFSEAEKEIMAAFGLNPLIEPKFWQGVVVRESAGRISQVSRGANLLVDYLPKIIPLLSQADEVETISVPDENKKHKLKTVRSQKIKFFIREDQAPNLSVVDFTHVLKALDNLYGVILKVNKLGHSELIVGALDSGSDKSLDVIGIAEAISKLSDLLLQAWDRARYARSSKTSASIKTVSDGIALITQISSAVSSGAINAAEGEKLRRTVFKSLEDLFSNGVYTAAMEADVLPRPSQLPVERQKLIEHRSKKADVLEAEETSDHSDADADEGDASDDDI